jgi:hypothetical protein
VVASRFTALAPGHYFSRQQTKEDHMARTTHRSAKGKKLYAVRDKKGQFKDIQTYKRAHGSDIKRKSKKER